MFKEPIYACVNYVICEVGRDRIIYECVALPTELRWLTNIPPPLKVQPQK